MFGGDGDLGEVAFFVLLILVNCFNFFNVKTKPNEQENKKLLYVRVQVCRLLYEIIVLIDSFGYEQKIF